MRPLEIKMNFEPERVVRWAWSKACIDIGEKGLAQFPDAAEEKGVRFR